MFKGSLVVHEGKKGKDNSTFTFGKVIISQRIFVLHIRCRCLVSIVGEEGYSKQGPFTLIPHETTDKK